MPSSVTYTCFPKPSETPFPEEQTPEPSIIPSLLPEFSSYEEYKKPSKYDYLGKTVCVPLNEKSIKLELKYLIDLAVKSDGSEVYVITRKCFDRNYNIDSIIYKDCQYSIVMNRRFIYKVKNQYQIELLKINNEYPLSCNLGEDIEINKNDEIYFTDSLNNIYKLSNNELRNISNYKYKEVLSRKIEDSIGRIGFVVNNNDEIYFYNTNSGEYNSYSYSVFSFLTNNINYINSIYSRAFTIYDNEIFTPYYKSNISKVNNKIDIASKKELEKTINGERGVTAIRINSKGEIFLASEYNHSIWKVNKEQKIERIGGNGKAGFMDGFKENAQFNYPTALSFDKYDNLYVADQGNHAIRKITPNGYVSTIYKEKE
ncbi:MAG: hypothetical protein U0354_10105 [Candidatus Sericytochromatia bacterium]